MFVCDVPDKNIPGTGVIRAGERCPLEKRNCHGICALWEAFRLMEYSRFLESGAFSKILESIGESSNQKGE